MPEAPAPAPQQAQFVTRVGSLPIVTTAVGQLAAIYQQTKQSNRLVKYTLESAETGIKMATNTAQPIITKLDKPIGMLDGYACGTLDVLEDKYPVIKKPTEEVYEVTLKPTVEQVNSLTQYSLEKVNNIKDTTVNTVNGVKTYSMDKIEGAKNYTVNTINGVKNYSYQTMDGAKKYSFDKIDGVKNYSYETLDGVKGYGYSKAAEAIGSPYGKLVTRSMNNFLERTEEYVDYYLPEDENEDTEEDQRIEVDEVTDDDVIDASSPSGTVKHVANLSSKLRRRMYQRSMKQLSQLHMRTKDTLDNLHFTVNLIDYAKQNIDGAKERVGTVGSQLRDNVTGAKARLGQIWQEVNMSEAQAAEGAAQQPDQVSDVVLEKRMIATARHLTLKVKMGLNSMSTMTRTYLPTTLSSRLTDAVNYSHQLYINWANVDSVKDLSQTALTQTREAVSHLQQTMTSMSDYLTKNPITDWLVPDFELGDLELGDDILNIGEVRYMEFRPEDMLHNS